MDKLEFVHLHNHTIYSINDGMLRAKQLADKLLKDGVNQFAVTEHGCLMNLPEIYTVFKKKNIKLIVGMEAYVAPRGRHKRDGKIDAANNHLVLLCENNEGYDNLKLLASDASVNGFYYKPRTDKDMLRQYHKGLICMSACLGGSVNQFLLNDDYEKAKEEALEYLDIFGKGNYFIEIQRHGLEEQNYINPNIIRLSNETGIPLVCTNDCHYLNKEDWEAHDILMAIQAGTNIYDKKRKVYGSHEFYVKTQDEMKELFSDIPEAVKNTVDIANRCNVKIDFETSKLPPFDIPTSYSGTNLDYFKEVVYEGSKIKYKELTKAVIDRIEYEIDIISNMGFVNYFLITWDFFRFCKTGAFNSGDNSPLGWEPILTGPGRGSCAGSIVSYCMDITKIDPLKYDLLFERFLDPSRISFPDIDSDFESTRRQEVIDYVVEKYGRENTAQIITFGTMAARSSIRKVGKAINMPLSLCDKIAKMIPMEIGITIKEALNINQEMRAMYESDIEIKRFIDFAISLEGTPNSISTHAAGVLITDNKGVAAHVPMWKGKDSFIAQFDKNILESMKLLKMDFLGLRTLNVVSEAIKFIKENHDVNIDLDYLYTIPDLKPLELIREGKTAGIFQLEGKGMTNFMKDLSPESIEDVIAGIAIFRPGPMKEIPIVLNNKRNPENISYSLDGLASILDSTYGVLIYQEQCMLAVVEIAGYQKSDSDGFRKVIAKKIEKLMPLHRRWFIHGRKELDYDEEGKLVNYTPIKGGIALGHSETALSSFFDKMEDFGKYCFNKSHSASYAYVAYITSWFMYYYPVEYLAALLNSVEGDRVKSAKYINFSRKILNIEVVEPCINNSSNKFIPVGNKIFHTLKVKGAGEEVVNSIYNERDKNGKFLHLADFLTRCRKFLNKATYEGLICSGALKCFGMKKSTLLIALDDFWEGSYKKAKDAENRTLKKNPNSEFNFMKELMTKTEGIFQEDIRELPDDVSLMLEKIYLGLYLSDNPLYKYGYTIQANSDLLFTDLETEVDEETGFSISSKEFIHGQRFKSVALLNTITERITKKKAQMANLELEDLTGVTEAIVWPKTYIGLKNKLKEGVIYLFEGYIHIDDGKPTAIIDCCEEISEKVHERLVIDISKPLEAVELINDMKSNKLSVGRIPIYLNYKKNQILLTENFWGNKDYILRNYNAKVHIW